MPRPIDANAPYAEISKWPESVMYKDWVQSAIANSPTLAPSNERLTLEVLRLPQLCQMKGKRVQVTRMGTMWQSEDATVFDNGDCRTDSGGLCYHELYGSTWIAFRLPPEEVQKHAETDRCE